MWHGIFKILYLLQTNYLGKVNSKEKLHLFLQNNYHNGLATQKSIQKKDGSPALVPEEAPSHIYFLKPQTYMNLSGESIIEVVNFYKLKPENVLVIHDELELPLGTVSLKWSGGLGGHNGLRSTKAVLNTPDFWRLRFGIGRPDNPNMNIADYVLSKFTAEQQEILQNVYSQTNLLLVKALLSKDPANLISQWGKKKLIDD